MSVKRIKGLGKGGAKRQRNVLRDNIQGITKQAVRSLVLCGDLITFVWSRLWRDKGRIESIFGELEPVAVKYTDNVGRKTLTTIDVD